MAEPIEPIYILSRAERAIFAEVYFPKKGKFQGEIFDALEDGYDGEYVKVYLAENIEPLLVELAEYHYLLDPYRYLPGKPETSEPPKDRALKRIEMYKSPFKG